MPSSDNYWLALIQAIADGRIEAKEVMGMEPEQREAYMERVANEEREAIDAGLARHETPEN
ncbi:hypothetical protein [Geitlerinema calcuttense]|uniref:Uncharacterized protein n=1 Tax=Geitlerinema calcuttense NRMC-F 0142 TaxID=2922238 RepID=A0ABT7LV33_9CYAN|nr:hypothetical protein [Geitlerinema calcuttense]MDL5055911.1 hypothetical protein [Geitlerinema calcuttense NRMC-F 0142]